MWTILDRVPSEEMVYDGACEYLSPLFTTPSGDARFRYAFNFGRWIIYKEQDSSSEEIVFRTGIQNECEPFLPLPAQTSLTDLGSRMGALTRRCEECSIFYARLNYNGNVSVTPGVDEFEDFDMFPATPLLDGACEYHSLDGNYIYGWMYNEPTFGWTLFRFTGGIWHRVVARRFGIFNDACFVIGDTINMRDNLERHPDNPNTFVTGQITAFFP